jgi:NAD-dependent dihydropyrimidine dehydrogenase PreA subunit
MYKIMIDFDKCQACGDCVDTCPSEVLVVTHKDGKDVADAVKPDDCIGCEACVATCPEEAIKLEEI